MIENYLGSDFDDFLAEEGLLEEAEATAMKRILAYQINQLMHEQNLSKAARSLGKRLRLTLV